MQKYLYINSVEVGKIEILVFIKPEETYIPVKKYIFLRGNLTPFTFDVLGNFLTVYVNAIGEIILDQTTTQTDSYIVLKINNTDVGDNSDVYTKLSVL